MWKGKIFAICFSIVMLCGCTDEKYDTDLCSSVSYSESVRPLISTRCSISGCHVSGFQPGDFSDYRELKQKVLDGKFQRMVFELNLMPPAAQLTKEETAILKCWVESGAKSD